MFLYVVTQVDSKIKISLYTIICLQDNRAVEYTERDLNTFVSCYLCKMRCMVYFLDSGFSG